MHNSINSYFIRHPKNLLRTASCPDFLTSVMTLGFIKLGRDTSLVIGHSSLLKLSAPRTLSSDQITLLGFVPRACIEETFSQLGFESEWCLFLFFTSLLCCLPFSDFLGFCETFVAIVILGKEQRSIGFWQYTFNRG